MRLDLDFGNSAIKAQLSLAAEIQPVALFSSVQHLMQHYADYPIEIIAVLPVAADRNLIIELNQWAQRKFNIHPVYAEVEHQACGVTCCYDEPGQLGADRWAAMIAAYNHQESADINRLVIDCGTAITLDWLDHTGHHLSGVIIPGLTAAYFALEQKTGLRSDPPASNTNAVSALGKKTPDTKAAVNFGIETMFNSFFRQQIQITERFFNGAYLVYLTGGDAHYFNHYLPADKLRYHADLTLQGLRLLLPQV